MAIEKLPNEIELVPEELEVYGEEFELEETEDRIEYIISSILTDSKLSSELPFKDILLCSKTVGLLQGGSSALTVEKADVVVYSFPSINTWTPSLDTELFCVILINSSRIRF